MESNLLAGAAIVVVGVAVLLILYGLLLATRGIRTLLAPEYSATPLPSKFHKMFWWTLGIVVAIGVLLFTLTLWPILFVLLCSYLGFKFGLPIAKKALS